MLKNVLFSFKSCKNHPAHELRTQTPLSTENSWLRHQYNKIQTENFIAEQGATGIKESLERGRELCKVENH